MSEIKWWPLPAASLHYIRNVLRDGSDLSLKVLKNVNLDAGRTRTALPEDAITDSLDDFESGGKILRCDDVKVTSIGRSAFFAFGIPSCLEVLIKYLDAALRQNKIVVVENREARPSDAWLLSSGIKSIFARNQVFHVLQKGDSFEKIIETVKKSVTLPYTAGFVFDNMPNLEFTGAHQISSPSAIFILGTYDTESFVLWENSEQ
jgi:hypothetical protein